MKTVEQLKTERNEYLKNIFVHPAKYKDKDVWFTDDRVNIMKDDCLYKYELRHDGDGTPVEISEHILADFYGTVLSNRPLELPQIFLSTIHFDDIVIDSQDFYVVDYNKKTSLLDIIKASKEKRNERKKHSS